MRVGYAYTIINVVDAPIICIIKQNPTLSLERESKSNQDVEKQLAIL